MLTLLLTLLVVTPLDTTDTSNRCDSLYVAAQSAHERVVAGKDRMRTAEAEQVRWRQTVKRFLTLAQKTRQCYGPLPLSSEAPSPDSETTLPTPTSLQRERIVETYDWITFAYRELQQYDKAFAQYEEFFSRFGARADSSNIAFMYHKRGYLHYRLGNLSTSIDDYTKTIAYTPTADTSDRIGLLTDLGIILQRTRDLKRARQYYTRAEEMARELPPSSNAQTLLARAIFLQGDVLLADASERDSLRRVADWQQAIRHVQEALDLYPSDAVERRTRAHILLGEAYSFLDDFDAAFRHLERGYRLAERLNDPDILTLAQLKLGKTHLIAGALGVAEQNLLQAVEYAQVAHDDERHRQVLHNLGRLFERQQDWPTAEDYYRRAIAVAEELRASLRATDWATGAFDQWVKPYRGLVRVLAAQERYEEAFLALERTRARHLQDLRLQARLTSTLPERDRVRFDSLTTELTEVRNALAKDDLLDSERNAFTSQEVRLMAERRAVLDLDVEVTIPPLETLQQRLQAHDRALVSYYIDNPSTFFGRAPRSLAFVLTADTLHVVSLDVGHDALRAALSDVSPLLTGDAPVDLNTVNFDLSALHELYQHLYAPIADHLPPDAPLTIIPDEPLFRLPFGMLVAEAPARFAYAEARFLIEERPLAAELSATLLADTTADATDYEHDLVALGRSEFDALPALPSRLRSQFDSTEGLPALPGVRREMETLDDLFARRRVLLDDEATEDTLYHFQDQTRVLHLASHALVDPSDPLANLFVLAPGAAGSRGPDGLLFLHEMERQRCPIPLVVLSACSTTQGIGQSGEGPRGLQYAFRAAGAQSTLSTLWDVDDDAATALTTSFYQHLQNDLPKDVALQRAKLDYLESHPETMSPFFWSGAVLYGDPRPLSLEPAPPIPLLPLAAGSVILLLVASGYLRFRRHAS